jgi:hypothetical protein
MTDLKTSIIENEVVNIIPNTIRNKVDGMALFDMSDLKEKIKKAPYNKLYNQYKNATLKAYNGKGEFSSQTIPELEVAISCAFFYYMEKNELFAKRAYRSVKKYLLDFETQDPKGLTHYKNLYVLSLCHQFCKGSQFWSRIEKQVSKKILKLADFCFFNGGGQQNQAPSSNWKALRYSVAGLGYMATDEEDHTKDAKVYGCYQRVKKFIYSNFGGGFGGIEGDGYTRFAWHGVGPFGIALERNYGWKIDDADDYAVEYQFMWSLGHTVPMELCDGVKGVSPDFVTDNPQHSSSKFMGLSFYYLDENQQSGLNHIFKTRFDSSGNFCDIMDSGMIYVLLYYNADHGETDPLQNDAWRECFAETTGNGFCGFRNRFKDENDIVAQLYARQRNHSGHKGPDVAGFRIIGLDNIWAIGGGWYKDADENGVAHFTRSANTVFPGGYGGPNEPLLHKPFSNTGKVIKQETFLSDSIEGYVIAGPKAQNDFDTDGLKRRFVAEFDIENCEAAFVIADTSLNGRYWQMSTFYPNEVTVNDNGFIITDPKTKNTLRGVILHPTQNFSVETGERYRGTPIHYGDEWINKNKYVLITRHDEVPGMTDEMKLPDKRGLRNSLLYHRDENGKLTGPNYDDHEGDFIVVLTLCNHGDSHPEVSMKGDRILNGVTINIGNQEISIEYEDVKVNND